MRRLYSWLLVWMSRLFHKFGIHCATHQIRLILISGLVITSLFYPAIGIYSDTISSIINYRPSGSFNNIFNLNPHTLIFSEKDLEDVWTGHKALRVLDDDVTRARCGNEVIVRMERVLLTTNGFDEDTGAINHETLSTALQFENALTDALSARNTECLRSAQGSCIRISPLALWNHNLEVLRNDRNLIQTVNAIKNTSLYGVPFRPSMVFAGREAAEPSESRIDFASYLAFTYFFHEEDCNAVEGHNLWIETLDEVASSFGALSSHKHEPNLIALDYNIDVKKTYSVSSMTLTLYLCYFIFFVYFSGSMRNMNSVHSRIGLCFTGMVEIIVSTITSLSVCALYGLRITLVPWGIFPIVIVFVGAENMFRLVSDVSKTSISLPVKERIGIGLGKAGTANTLKVVSYNTILGVIAGFSQGAIRQFCGFAIVVLVAHWFLIHTFFVAVLSIDIQRLELDDLIRQESSGAVPKHRSIDSDKSNNSFLSSIASTISKVMHGRITRNFSLLLLLVLTGALYYSTLPPQHGLPPPIAVNRASVLRNKTEFARLNDDLGARDIWHFLNPGNRAMVHIRVETPAILALDIEQDIQAHEKRPSRTRWRIVRPLWWMVKFMVVPIGGTLGSLYALLLYLLKGTERLYSYHLPKEEEEGSDSIMLEKKPPLKIFPRAFATDVALLATNADGSVVASVSSEGEAYIWRLASQAQLKIDLSEISLQGASRPSAQTAPSCITLNGRGSLCAVGTRSGVIGVWAITGASAHFQGQYFLDGCRDMVWQLHFDDSTTAAPNATTTARHRGFDEPSNVPSLIAIFSNGRIATCLHERTIEQTPHCAGHLFKAFLIRSHGDTPTYMCFSFDDGGIEIARICKSSKPEAHIMLQGGSSSDRVVDVAACHVTVGEISRLFVAVAIESGIVTVFDAATETVVASLDDVYGSSSSMQLLASTPAVCPQCGEIPSCEMQLIFSVGHLVFAERISLVSRCSCPPKFKKSLGGNPFKDSPKGRRSRSGSFVSSSHQHTSRPRSRHVSMSSDTGPDISAFPVSGHGRHSKRASDRDGFRRSTDFADKLPLPSVDSLLSDGKQANDDGMLTIPESSSPPKEALRQTFRSVRVYETTCERGGWGVVNNKLVVLRRKPRDTTSTSIGSGQTIVNRRTDQSFLSASTLDRWEVWILDLSKKNGLPQSSSLAYLPSTSLTLSKLSSDSHSFLHRPAPRLPFTRLVPIYFKNTVCVAGLGNTVGMIDFASSY